MSLTQFIHKDISLVNFWKGGAVWEIKDIEKVMLENNALGSMMSGSGPTVFGLFDKEEDALSAKGELLKKYNQVYVVRSSEKGVEVNGEFN